MKDQKSKERFVELRAEGLSFDKIAKMIKISKPTLINWNRELTKQIEEVKNIRYGEILEKYKVTKEKRIARLARALDQAWQAYDKKDYKNLSKRDLLLIINQLDKRLTDEIREIKDDINDKKNKKPDKLTIKLVKKIIGNDGKLYLESADGKHRRLLEDNDEEE